MRRKLLDVNFWKQRSELIVSPFVNLLIQLRISPNSLTYLALLTALLSVFYLFSNHALFITFMLVNLALDILDGQLARKLEKVSVFGDKLDKFSDSLFGILILLKAGLVLEQPLAYAALILYLIHMRIAGKAWYTLFGPNTTFLKLPFLFYYYSFGVAAQITYTVVAMFGSRYYYSKIPSSS